MNRDTKDIEQIIIHYSQTPEGREVKISEIDSWHKERGFDSIGYHYVVHLDGSVSVGRPLNVVGAHTRGYNKKSIGICYIGGTVEGGKDTRTEAQKVSLINLLMSLVTVIPTIKEIAGHNDYSEKECPAFNVKNEYSYIFQNTSLC